MGFLNQVPGYADPFHDYTTKLSPGEEMFFRQWVSDNNVPFNPNARQTDYDMRGFYKGMLSGDPHATTGFDMTDGGRLHFGDYYKTPSHQSYSNESQGANPITAPRWVQRGEFAPQGGTKADDWVLSSPTGEVLKDWRNEQHGPTPAEVMGWHTNL